MWEKHNKGVSSSSVLFCKLILLFHPLITLPSKLIDLNLMFQEQTNISLAYLWFCSSYHPHTIIFNFQNFTSASRLSFHPVHELHSYLAQTDMNTTFAFLSSHYIWYILLVPGDTGILKCSFLPDYNSFNASCSYLSSVALKNNLYIRSTQ